VVAVSLKNKLKRLAPPTLPEAEIEMERRRIEGLLVKRRDGVAVASVKTAVRTMMWNHAGVEKDAASLRTALDELSTIRLDLLPRMSLARTARGANYEWLDAIDAINMVEACELILHSSLERTESRGPFMRRDFPLQDNRRWLAANVMVRTENGFRFEQRPYDLPFFKPDFAERNNLEVAW
jgi:succinate dehydrogenase/fumarate reductase flavoprotein subunit